MREYLFVFVIAAATTFAVIPLIRALAVKVGAITPVRDRDVHTIPIPRLGGLGILVGFLAAVAVAYRLPHLSQIFDSTEIRGIAIGAVLMGLVGAVDDVRELDWLTKLSGQIVAAGAMAYFGVQLLSLPLVTVTVLPAPVLVALTVLLVLVTTNAVNFIDGLDGLSAGIVAIAALAFFVYAYQLSRSYNPPNVFSTATFVSAATLGCCIGFLPHNFHPARLFMGDAGALLLGQLLSAATISMMGNVDPGVDAGRGTSIALFLPLIIPLAIMAIPLLDMVLAVVRRTRRGQRPWTPDKEHLQHRMLQIGHSHRGAVLLLYLWAAIIALGAVSFEFVTGLTPLLLIGAAVLGALWLTRYLPRLLDGRAR